MTTQDRYTPDPMHDDDRRYDAHPDQESLTTAVDPVTGRPAAGQTPPTTDPTRGLDPEDDPRRYDDAPPADHGLAPAPDTHVGARGPTGDPASAPDARRYEDAPAADPPVAPAPDPSTAPAAPATASASDVGAEGREQLVPADRAQSYGSRWDGVKGTFVDEPRQAVAQADALVGELLGELEQLFREQRRSIEQGLDADETSTEDLRLALRRYRSFFDRLLAL